MASLSVEDLRSRIQSLENGPKIARTYWPSGIPSLDAALPGGGLCQGSLLEIFSQPGSSTGGWRLALLMLASILKQRPGLAVLFEESSMRFFGPALEGLGLPLPRLMQLRCRSLNDKLWALEELLRSPVVSACVLTLRSSQNRVFRRLQLLAESSGQLVFLLRPLKHHGRGSFGRVQLRVQNCSGPSYQADQPARRAFRVDVLRCRGRAFVPSFELEVDHARGALSRAAALSH